MLPLRISPGSYMCEKVLTRIAARALSLHWLGLTDLSMKRFDKSFTTSFHTAGHAGSLRASRTGKAGRAFRTCLLYIERVLPISAKLIAYTLVTAKAVPRKRL